MQIIFRIKYAKRNHFIMFTISTSCTENKYHFHLRFIVEFHWPFIYWCLITVLLKFVATIIVLCILQLLCRWIVNCKLSIIQVMPMKKYVLRCKCFPLSWLLSPYFGCVFVIVVNWSHGFDVTWACFMGCCFQIARVYEWKQMIQDMHVHKHIFIRDICE